jgi:hypothetical protein
LGVASPFRNLGASVIALGASHITAQSLRVLVNVTRTKVGVVEIKTSPLTCQARIR